MSVRDAVVLDEEAGRAAFRALQELRWRASEGDDTAVLSAEQEELRADLQRTLFPEGVDERVPWSQRESTEMARDLKAVLGAGAHGTESLAAVAGAVSSAAFLCQTEGVSPAQAALRALQGQPVFTAGEVRSLLERFYNRPEEEAQRVTRTWLELRRGRSDG